MKKNESIQDRFSNFEPPVDEFTIDKSWEKIRYFVPQKEKKRRFFILLPVFYIPFIILLFFAIGITSLHRIQKIQKYEAYDQIKQKNMHEEPFNTKFETKKNSLNTKTQQQTPPDLFQEKTLRYYIPNIMSRKNTGKASVLSALNPTFNEKGLPPFAEASPEIQILVLDTAVKAVDNANLRYERLEPILLTSPDSNYLNKTIVLNDIVREFHHKKANRLSVDVVGGIQNAFTQIKHESENISHRNMGLNYLFGIGIKYQIKNRLCLTGQFISSENKKLYEETLTGNHVVKKYQMSPTQVSSDTTYYIKTTSRYYIKPNYNFNLGLGIEYGLFRKNKITVNAALLLNTLVANYKYSISRSSERDTLIQVGPYSNTGIYGTGSSNFKNGRSEVSKKSIDLGIMPGFVIGYKLNSRAILIFKSSFFLNFSPLKSEDPGSEFSVKQNNLLLQLGVRFLP